MKRARLFKRSRVQRRRPHRLVAGIRARAGKVQKTDGLSMMQEVGSVLAVGAVVTYSDTSSSSGCVRQARLASLPSSGRFRFGQRCTGWEVSVIGEPVEVIQVVVDPSAQRGEQDLHPSCGLLGEPGTRSPGRAWTRAWTGAGGPAHGGSAQMWGCSPAAPTRPVAPRRRSRGGLCRRTRHTARTASSTLDRRAARPAVAGAPARR